jgi:predicted MFS family arabinose efflux permease
VNETPETRPAAPGLALMVLALLPFGLGYFFSYLYRAVNAVVAPDLVRDLGLTASELGLLTSAYLLAFALFQLPLGILLDRFGPRRVQAALVATGAAGALLFALATSVPALTVARAIIGMGFAGGLMAAFKAVVIWVPEPRRALANALVMSLGAVGVILASAPMEYAVGIVGWRQAFVYLAAATLAVALMILVVVPERPAARSTASLASQIADVGRIYRDPVFLALVPVLAIPAGSHIALQTLWAGPWFTDVEGLSRAAAATGLFWMGVAFLVGVLMSGVVADILVRRGISLLTANIGFLAVFLAAQAVILAGGLGHGVLAWSVFAMTGHTAVLAYPWISSYFGPALSGRSNTAINLLMFGTAFLVQFAVGWIIDLFPAASGGRYHPDGYRTAFGIVLGLELAALAWFAWNRRLLADAERAMQTKRAAPPPVRAPAPAAHPAPTASGTMWATGPAT